MQNPKLKWILTILTVIIMLVIFFMSSKPGTESREDSNFFSLRLVSKVIKDYDDLAKWQQFRAEENLDELIRKLAYVVSVKYSRVGNIPALPHSKASAFQ